MKSAAVKSQPRKYHQRARAEAAQATADRLAEAFLTRLMTQWFDEITLDRVAEDAGVTVQTVVRRFGGKEGLLGEAIKLLEVQVNARRATPIGDIDRIVTNVINDYEAIGDAISRLLALEPRHDSLKEFLDLGRRWHREWIERVFVHELEPLDAPQRKHTLDALVIATDIYTWKLLRRDMGRSVRATASTMTHLIRNILSNHSQSSFAYKHGTLK